MYNYINNYTYNYIHNITTWKVSVFSGIPTEYGEIFSPTTGKYGPEKPRIRTLFTQCMCIII